MSSSSSSASLVNEDLITTISGLISLIHEERQRVDGILELSHLDDHIITIHQNELEDYKIIINKLTQELSNQTIKLINKNNLLKYYERQDRDQLTNKEEVNTYIYIQLLHSCIVLDKKICFRFSI